MANPYAALFQVPGARAFVLAGMLARMPVSMTGIGLITMLAQVHGGYGLAGARISPGGRRIAWAEGTAFKTAYRAFAARRVVR